MTEVWCRNSHTPPLGHHCQVSGRPCKLLRRHRNTSDSSGSDASHSENIERLDLSTCVCSHLVCESSDKPITCDTGLIDTAVATVHEVVGLCQACGMHLDPTSLNFHCHGTTRHSHAKLKSLALKA